ncbi:hypothetical protein [Aerosakkonema funiforme]
MNILPDRSERSKPIFTTAATKEYFFRLNLVKQYQTSLCYERSQ